MLTLRDADPERDGAACAAIYAPSVADGVASLEERAPEAHEMTDRIRIVTRSYPWLVAEIDGEVVGYAYASRHRERAAYRWSADVTIYIAAGHHRTGIGRALYGALFGLLEAQGVHELCAGITLPNPGSVRLHESFGFELIGVYQSIGFKLGVWRDVGWWQKPLRERTIDRIPAELGPPIRLDAT